MEDTLFLQLYDFDSIVSCPLETFIVLSVYKYCNSSHIRVVFTVSDTQPREKCVQFELQNIQHSVISKNSLPWQVNSCKLPVLITQNTVITGSCAVSRQLCKTRKSQQADKEHPEGLLGFRSGCLQAPNEVSVWTKFCEIEISEATKSILQNDDMEPGSLFELPNSLVRFEKHLMQPLRIHNIYKVVRELTAATSSKNIPPNATTLTNNEEKHADPSPRMKVKHRNWKSSAPKIIERSTSIENFKLNHIFAEGPFVTLADIILFAHYFFVFSILNGDKLEEHLPETNKWFQNLKSQKSFETLNEFLTNTIACCKFEKTHNIIKIIEYKLPVVENTSLYKCDPKRSNPKKRLYTKEEDIESALSLIMDNMELDIQQHCDLSKFDWLSIPDEANPFGDYLPDKRKIRKTQQLENLAISVMKIAKDGDKIVDFCSGSGHLGILLACLLPNCTLILLENKEESLNRAKLRVINLNLRNVYFFQCNLDFFTGTFDIGVALHACGIATDLALENCINKNASFVICPCCYGSLHTTERIHYPRSKAFSSFPLDKYICIGHAADQTHSDHPLEERGARCMAIIDSDRAQYAMNNGYDVQLSRLHPLSCTPKNMLIIGIPQNCSRTLH